MTSPTVQVAWLACLTLCVACSRGHEPHPPLAVYSKLRCASLQTSFGDDVVRATRSDKPTALDPTLGWSEKLEDLGGMCAGPDTGNAVYCGALRRHALRYTAFQERPLDGLGVEEAFRGLYDPSRGAAVLVRAVRFGGQSFLVAKVLEQGPGPLAWITSRRLSGTEWAALERAAAALPKGSPEYFPRFSLIPTARPEYFPQVSPTPTVRPVCETMDGADVQVEVLRAGELQVLWSTYEPSGSQRCSGPCCDPRKEAISRFFDGLLDLVDCVRSVPLKK